MVRTLMIKKKQGHSLNLKLINRTIIDLILLGSCHVFHNWLPKFNNYHTSSIREMLNIKSDMLGLNFISPQCYNWVVTTTRSTNNEQ